MPIRPLLASRAPSAALAAAALLLWTGAAPADPLVIEKDGVVRIGPPAGGGAALDVAGTIAATGLTATGPISGTELTTTGAITATGLTTTGPITTTGLTATGPVTATGLTATGQVTATGLTASGLVSGQSLGISLGPRTNPDNHPKTPEAMVYVTGDLAEGAPGADHKGHRIEFRHSNGTEGIGIGYNTLYATGSNANQPLKLAARGDSPVVIAGNGKLRLGDKWNIIPEQTRLIFSHNDQPIMVINLNERLQYNVPGLGVYYLGRRNNAGIRDNVIWESDLHLKQDIVRIPGALDKVRGLSGVRFRWNADAVARFEAELEPDAAGRAAVEAEARKPTIGVIAQEVEAALPEAVRIDADGYRSVNYRDLIPLLIEAAKEQDAIVAAQAAELTQLRAEVATLSAQAAQLKALEARFAALAAQLDAMAAAAPIPTSH